MTGTTISLIMPTIDGGSPFDQCLHAAEAALAADDQLLVVFDGMPPPPPRWLLECRATLLHTDRRRGPAAARNLAAGKARGEILMFVDADVELHADAVARLRARFEDDPDLQAVFGSYDAMPPAPGLVSRFRNLLHHHTHSSQPGPACTFWAGCGAVRRQPFLELGGFDEAYRHPCIEDIDFGMRLHESGGKILLDPTIQGSHHKRWTLGLMVRTDIRQRAIPWSRLLLQRRQIPATLNIAPAARLSAALSVMLPLEVALLTSSVWRPWALMATIGTLALLLLLNRSFLALLQRQGGIRLAIAGACLHLLYLMYSSLSFAGVFLYEKLLAPFRAPAWLSTRPLLLKSLASVLLLLLALLATAATLKGMLFLWQAVKDTDLHERQGDWRVFRDHIYPAYRLATPEQRALPYFNSTVYLPWALPLFGALFAWGGIWQGKIVMLSTSLAALALIARVGWLCLRPWGLWAGWLGALSPLAITGNANCLAHGQFSIVCMGLITIQWLLLERQQPRAAGLCWALAMVKPQIAVTFALPFFQRRRVSGLVMGTALLLGLSATAFAYTGTSPLRFLSTWVESLPGFINLGNYNLLLILLPLLQGMQPMKLAFIAGLVLVVSGVLLFLGRRFLRRRHQDGAIAPIASISPAPLELAGFCALLGFLGFYHRHYDNIMLYPALLASWRASLVNPCVANLLLALLMAVSVWTPQSLLDPWPGAKALQTLIWLSLAVVLLKRILRPRPVPAAS